jgi:hypothetical protein
MGYDKISEMTIMILRGIRAFVFKNLNFHLLVAHYDLSYLLSSEKDAKKTERERSRGL